MVDDGEHMHEKQRTRSVSALKQQVFMAVEDPLHAQGAARVFGIGLFVLIVLNALLVFAGPEFDTDAGLSVSSVCFGVEYLARLWVADLVHPERTPAKARLRYVFSVMGIIDLLAFLPGLLAVVIPMSSSALNAARVIRLLRLFKLSRYMRGLHSIARVFEKRRQEIIASFAVLALLTVTASVLMYEAEHDVQPDKFDSVLTGVYWAMTTITTTGYGDLVPLTPFGRFVGFCTMVLSIGVVAIPAGIFSAGCVAEFRTQDALVRPVRKRQKEADDDGGQNIDDQTGDGCDTDADRTSTTPTE